MGADGRWALWAALICAGCADGVITGEAVSSRYSTPAPSAAVKTSVRLEKPVGSGSGSGHSLTVGTTIWFALTDRERASVKARYDVDVSELANVGTIIDVQGIDESTGASSAGARVGGAVGGAMYVDNAFKGQNFNYSATRHVGAALLGAVVGSAMLDHGGQRAFRFQYTIRDVAGNLTQFERVDGRPFHQPVGVCVETSTLTTVDSSRCEDDLAAFRRKYLSKSSGKR